MSDVSKRKNVGNEVIQPLKRANSSLFSISTVLESDGEQDPHLDVDAVKQIGQQDVRAPIPSFSEMHLHSSSLSSLDEKSDDCKLGRSSFGKHDLSPREDKGFIVAVEASRFEGENQPNNTITSTVSSDHRTGLVFEASELHFDRNSRYHKERSLRITSVMRHLSEQCIEVMNNAETVCSKPSRRISVMERCVIQTSGSSPDDESHCSERYVLNDEDYLRVHLPGYLRRLDTWSKCSCYERLDRESEQFQSVYLTLDSAHEAKNAANSLCKLVRKVINADLDNGFAVVRPPGHHAEPGVAGGYCIINNVAVAASYAINKLGVQKVLIVDWDVHHGNGTQDIFINNPDVLYFSVHRYHGGNYFPFLSSAGATNVGTGEGIGFNVNVGWNKKNLGDNEYVAVWEKLLKPMAQEFNPDLILVSAGFDAAEGDMGEMLVTPECFGRLTRALMTLANGKVVCTLEGGYVRSRLGKCVASVIESLLDKNSKQIAQLESEMYDMDQGALSSIDNSAMQSITATLQAHEQYWDCFLSEKPNST